MMRLLVPVLALMLAACAKEPAAYLIAGNDVAITLERIQPYFWSTGWQLDVIVNRSPDCQRRHHLKPTAGAKVKVEVFNPEPAIYILKQGRRWYVAELRSCGLEAFKEPPPEPGELVGTFQVKDNQFTFVAAAGNGGGAEAANGE